MANLRSSFRQTWYVAFGLTSPKVITLMHLEEIFKGVLTIYGLSWSCEQDHLNIQRSIPIKLDFNWPNGFKREVSKC